MDEAEGSNYWCHMCSQTVDPIVEVESIKCPICRGGFVEEMASATAGNAEFGASDSDPQNVPIGSSGEYFVGRSLDLLLQHLAESDPSRYGTPPARKDVVEALPEAKIEGASVFQCSVCLEEFENGGEAKEMPCNHKFHSGCILPWLERHSSCPVCRYQLPSDESKINPGWSRFNGNTRSSNDDDGSRPEEGNEREGSNENGRGFSLALPWPYENWGSTSIGPSSNEQGN